MTCGDIFCGKGRLLGMAAGADRVDASDDGHAKQIQRLLLQEGRPGGHRQFRLVAAAASFTRTRRPFASSISKRLSTAGTSLARQSQLVARTLARYSARFPLGQLPPAKQKAWPDPTPGNRRHIRAGLRNLGDNRLLPVFAPTTPRVGDKRILVGKIISTYRHGHSSCGDIRHKQDLYLCPAAMRPSPKDYGAGIAISNTTA